MSGPPADPSRRGPAAGGEASRTDMPRRDFVRWAGLGLVAPALGAGGAARAGAAGGADRSMGASRADREIPGGGGPPGRRTAPASPAAWPGYDAATVVDALASPGSFNVPGAGDGLPPGALEAARASGITAVNVTVGAVGEAEDPFEDTVKDVARWEAEIDRHPDVFRRIRTAGDLDAAERAGQVGLIYGFQDTVMLGADLERLDAFHALGVRVVQLTYNGRNRVGDGSLEPGNAGLSRFGHELVARMGALGVVVDLSHCGQRTTAEGIAAAVQPPAITHTGCDAVFSHPRNKRDAELRALADRGGVVGIYLMPYLNPSGPPSAADVLAHIEHALDVCGEDHVGIGSDQSITPVPDGPEYRARLRQTVERRIALGISAPREDTAPFVPELNDPRRMEMIADRMAARGHPDRVIEKVLGANWVRLFGEVWG